MAGKEKISLWQKLFPAKVWHIALHVGTPAEVPAKLPERAAVIVGTAERPKALVLDCPCGAGHRINVMLDPANNPHWKILQEEKLSVYPSINNRESNRHCHFMITNGNILWVQTQGSE